MTRRATCCCGACAIEVAGEPVINGICHCANETLPGGGCGWNPPTIRGKKGCHVDRAVRSRGAAAPNS